jgi:lysophospholipase L1-like esterase
MTSIEIEKLDLNFAQARVEGDVQWHDIREWDIEGRGWNDTESPFDRLPARARSVVREPVWNLSRHSSGLSVRFVTDAAAINARWRLRSQSLAMAHMPATGVSGLDLYIRGTHGWRWAGAGRPEKSPDNDVCLVSGLKSERHECQLYLPLYNGVERVAVGVHRDAFIGPAPARPKRRRQPICIYGTSVTQGGCASRPGMAFPAIIGRRLDRPVINLGFSGNGQGEPEISRLLAELDPAVYVIDCLTNMNINLITERIDYMVQALRTAHPETPIVFVECLRFQNENFVNEKQKGQSEKTAAMKVAYDRLQARNVAGLHIIKAEKLMGTDGEGTVDGIHATDLGFIRIADVITPVLVSLV